MLELYGELNETFFHSLFLENRIDFKEVFVLRLHMNVTLHRMSPNSDISDLGSH